MDTNSAEYTAIECEVIDLASNLYDSFNEDTNSIEFGFSEESHLDLLSTYITHITKISNYTNQAEYEQIFEISNEFLTILTAIKNNKGELNRMDKELLEQWPMLTMMCISDPKNIVALKNLSNILNHASWKRHLNPDFNTIWESFTKLPEAQPPLDVPVSSIASKDAINVPQDSSPSNPDFSRLIYNALQDDIVDIYSVYVDEVSHYNLVTGHLENQVTVSSENLKVCADRFEILAFSAGSVGLLGIMDVCLILHHNFYICANQNNILSSLDQQFIEQCFGLMYCYFEDPMQSKFIDPVINYVQSHHHASPLLHEEAGTLCTLLGTSAVYVFENEESAKTTSDLSIANGVEKPYFTAHSRDATNFQQTEKETNNHSDWRTHDAFDGEIGDRKTTALSDIETEFDLSAHKTDLSSETNLSEQALELVGLVKSEIHSAQPDLLDALTKIAEKRTKIADRRIALESYKDYLQRFCAATLSVGLTGLHQFFTHITDNLDGLTGSKVSLNKKKYDLLCQWPGLVLDYLNRIDDQEKSASLINFLGFAEWPNKPADSDLNSIGKELRSPKLALDEDEHTRPTTASAQDVSLQLPEDVNPQLLESLLQELPNFTAEFSAAIERIVSGDATLQDVEKAQRIAHTLKGSANTVGVSGIANITHHIEDILLAFSKHGLVPDHDLATALMNAADLLEMMSEYLLGIGKEPEHSQAILQQILQWANKIDSNGVATDVNGRHIQGALQNIEPETTQKTQHAKITSDSIVTQLLRVPAHLVDELLRLVGESIIVTSQLQERLNQAMEQTQSTREQNLLFQQLTYDLEQVVEVRGLASFQTRSQKVGDFDSLEFDQYNELHTVTRRLVEAATDSKEMTQGIEDHLDALESLLIDQRRLHKDSQEAVMHTRMIPVKNIVPRLQRSVRQTSRLTDKTVELFVHGEDTLIDSDILNELAEPLMHLLRNAADHGIESVEQRNSVGKNPVGKIDLTFFREGDHIVVRCIDDGMGLDFKKIRSTAKDKGIIKQTTTLSDEELARLILLPGFTTKSKTTQVSGRGIGMDAVYSSILSMKGGLNIESETGQGCTIEIRLPLSLISIHALLIQVGNQVIAVSNRGIEQILYAGAGTAYKDEELYVFAVENTEYDAFDLESLLHLPVGTKGVEQPERPVLLVKDENGKLKAIFVEHVLASQDLVVKQMGKYVANIVGIEGATILGDGSVASVLDLPALLRNVKSQNDSYVEIPNDYGEETDQSYALVVDDSLSARRSLAQFIQDIGFKVKTARDGLEAIGVIEEQKPDIIFVDLEMPRMNGLELTSHVRASEATKDTPIIMVTSRSTEKHRQQANAAGVNEYFTKPFSEDELLRSIESLVKSHNT